MKVSKHFKLDTVVIECIDQIKSLEVEVGKKQTQTNIVEQAIFHYYVTLFGEKALADIILKK
ncbi:MAG: hypothetical protein RR557_07115 [Bacilli bacterium]